MPAPLEQIACRAVSVKEAATLLQVALDEGVDPASIVQSLRAWTWKTLTAQVRSGDLAQWHDLFRRVAEHLRPQSDAFAERTILLAELVHESIVASETSNPALVLQRRHARDLLSSLHESPEGKLDRKSAGSALSLDPIGLARIVNLLLDARLIVETRGEILEITSDGRRSVDAVIADNRGESG